METLPALFYITYQKNIGSAYPQHIYNQQGVIPPIHLTFSKSACYYSK